MSGKTNHAGETLAVRARTENNSSIELSYLAIEIERDSDGDGLINSEERLGFRTGWDGRVYTDPYSRDSDGDGLSDGREVGRFVESSTLAGGYYLLESNPSEVDSDGDGLSDPVEREGWRIYYSETPDQSKRFLSSLYRNESTPEAKLTPLYVSSSALRSDTDDDDVSDVRELRLGTHPDVTDTDSDGVPDEAELALDTDPTLHDFRGPVTRVSSHTTTFIGDNFDEPIAHYLTYSLVDPSGVDAARIVRRGEEESVSRWTGSTSVSEHRDRYNTSYLEETVGLLSGVRTKVITTDSHGNRHVTAAYSRPNFAGRLASHLSRDITHPETAENLGKLSGFATGLGGTVSTIETLRDHPEEFIQVIDAFLKILQNLGLLAEFLERLPESIQRKQNLQNPYNPDDPTEEELYERFQRGWIAGYVLYFVVEAWIGTKGASALKNSDRATELVRAIDRTGHLRKGYRYYVGAKGTATQPAKKAGVKLASGVKTSAGYSLRSSRRMFAGVRTVGKQVSVSRQLRRVEPAKVSDLPPRLQTRLQTVLLGDTRPGYATKFISRARSEDLTAYLRLADDGGVTERQLSQVARGMGADGAEIPFAALRRNLDEVHEIDHRNGETIIRGTRSYDQGDIDVEMRYADDGESYVRKLDAVDENADLSELSAHEKGEIGEEITEDIFTSDRYEVPDGFKKADISDNGFDYVVYDKRTDEWVIIETKFKSSSGRVGKGWLAKTDHGRQMSDQWINKKLLNMMEKGGDEAELATDLQTAMETGNVRKEVIAIKNSGRTGETVYHSLSDLGIKKARLISLGKVIG